jgi:hypothetical protein
VVRLFHHVTSIIYHVYIALLDGMQYIFVNTIEITTRGEYIFMNTFFNRMEMPFTVKRIDDIG